MLMCGDCQAARGRSGPYPVMTRAEMRAGLDLMATWALEQKRPPPTASSSRPCACDWLPASRWLACTRSRGLAWLERQAEEAEELVAQRKRTTENRPGS